MQPSELNKELYERFIEFEHIGNRAVRKAQEESRCFGVPNVYTINGIVHYERPDGTLTTEDPYEEWQQFIKERNLPGFKNLEGLVFAIFFPASIKALALLCTLAACASTKPTTLQESTWTGGLTPMNHPEMVMPITYDVSHADGHLAVTLITGDIQTPMRDAQVEGDTLSFVFNEPEANVLLTCVLARQEDKAMPVAVSMPRASGRTSP